MYAHCHSGHNPSCPLRCLTLPVACLPHASQTSPAFFTLQYTPKKESYGEEKKEEYHEEKKEYYGEEKKEHSYEAPKKDSYYKEEKKSDYYEAPKKGYYSDEHKEEKVRAGVGYCLSTKNKVLVEPCSLESTLKRLQQLVVHHVWFMQRTAHPSHCLFICIVHLLSSCRPQHDEYDSGYGKKDEGKKGYGYGKEETKKSSGEKKGSSFYDPPNFYIGKYGLGHFGENNKGSKGGYKKGAHLEWAGEAEIQRMYDHEGYDAAGYSREGYHKEGYNLRGYDKYGYDR
jgi:hypothetical protein